VARGRDWRRHYEEGVKALQSRPVAVDVALKHFGRAVELEPDRWEPYYGRAWSLLKEQPGRDHGQLGEAERDLVRAMELGGGSDAAALLAHVHALQGDHEPAVTRFLEAIGRSSQVELVEDGLIGSLSELLSELETGPGDEEAIATCDRLVHRLEAGSLQGQLKRELLAEVMATRAYCHQKAGDEARYESDLRQVVRLIPKHQRVPEELRTTLATGATASQGRSDDPTFDSFGGLDVQGTFGNRLKKIFEHYFGDSDIESLRKEFAEWGQSPTRSILLFGPSGCGKTYLIRTFAGEYRRRHRRELPIHRLRLNEILIKWVGESEKSITRIIDQAIDNQPSILFGDEIDSIGMTREDGQDWRIQLTAHFLQEIDRLRESGAAVMFFGCTNRVWAVDLALLRRFDEMMPVEMPNDEVRERVFQVHLARLSARVKATDLDLRELIERSHGLTPGDIEKVIRRGVDSVLTESLGNENGRPLSEEDLLRALEEYRQPMHVREWVRQSVAALRRAEHTEMADELEETYRPFVGGDVEVPPEARGWRPIPAAAWIEHPDYDLAMMRWTRR
jgi:ATP-dependent 26S proteasome regulatory subunit